VLVLAFSHNATRLSSGDGEGEGSRSGLHDRDILQAATLESRWSSLTARSASGQVTWNRLWHITHQRTAHVPHGVARLELVSRKPYRLANPQGAQRNSTELHIRRHELLSASDARLAATRGRDHVAWITGRTYVPAESQSRILQVPKDSEPSAGTAFPPDLRSASSAEADAIGTEWTGMSWMRSASRTRAFGAAAG
jgi:hypothetical protein